MPTYPMLILERYVPSLGDWSYSTVNHINEFFVDSMGYDMVSVRVDNNLNLNLPTSALTIVGWGPVIFDAMCADCQYELHVCPWCDAKYAHDGSDLEITHLDHSDVCVELVHR